MMTDKEFLTNRKAHLRVLEDLERRLSTLKTIIKGHRAKMAASDRWLLIEHGKDEDS